MSERAQVEIDKLIRGGEALHGSLAMSGLPELADRLASGDGAVAWSVRAERDAHGRPRLTLGLDGQLQLICQRCLGPLPFAVRHQHALVVVKSEAELPDLEDEEDDSDFIVVPGALDMQNAVLEELLLALPMMPRHETEQCHGPKDGPDAEEGGKPSPFAVLRGSPKT